MSLRNVHGEAILHRFEDGGWAALIVPGGRSWPLVDPLYEASEAAAHCSIVILLLMRACLLLAQNALQAAMGTP